MVFATFQKFNPLILQDLAACNRHSGGIQLQNWQEGDFALIDSRIWLILMTVFRQKPQNPYNRYQIWG